LKGQIQQYENEGPERFGGGGLNSKGGEEEADQNERGGPKVSEREEKEAATGQHGSRGDAQKCERHIFSLKKVVKKKGEGLTFSRSTSMRTINQERIVRERKGE